MKNAKSRPKTRFDKASMLLLNNTWQEWIAGNQTFDLSDDEEQDFSIEEICEILDG